MTPVRRRWWILAVLSVSLLIVSLDTTILNVALPAIARTMNASSSELQWIVDSYSVVLGGLLLVSGSVGDRVGRKGVLMTGLVVFGAGSAGAAWSGTPTWLMATRAFMGIGAAAIMPSTLSILTNVFSADSERARAIGIWSGTTGLGVAIGPVAGGWLLAHFWWGSVFLVNVPVTVLGFVAVASIVPASRNEHAKRADVVGGLLSIAGLALFLWGIIDAPSRTWTSPVVLSAMAGGAALLAAFVWWERRSAHPMLEISAFSSPRFSVAMMAMSMVIFALMGGMFLLTQYLQFSLGFSALQAGLRIAPIALMLLIVAPISGMLVRLVGTKPIVFGGMVLITSGLALLSGVTVADSYPDVLPAFLLIGVGTGLALAPCIDSVMGALEPEMAGVAAGTNGAALQVGGALGVGILGSALNTRYQDVLRPHLQQDGIPAAVQHVVTGSLGGALEVAQRAGGTAGSQLAALARHAFVEGMDLAVTLGALVVGAAAVLVLLLLPNRPTARRGGRPMTRRAKSL